MNLHKVFGLWQVSFALKIKNCYMPFVKLTLLYKGQLKTHIA
jgi:hypothetical protein